ncbi:MAG: hypothetical protein JO092_07055 [Candidatus Eremiobacteraeota bacterium]|nr:hypothetical protein [Candidatus Eremiobacteraeota bacterium]MBV8374036.1 hypothetical protein [Candidatus Eremiobacteraeota bacterium]
MRSLAWCGAIVILVACAGGQSAIPAPPESTTNMHPVSVTLRIHVPKRRLQRVRHAPRPNYVSPATQAMTLDISGPTRVYQVVPLTPTSSGCSTNPTGTTCQLTLVLAACRKKNCYLATVATYDAVSCASACTIPPSANELSAAQDVPFTVHTGKENVVSLVLGGVPVSIEVTPLHPGYLQGDAHRLQLWGPTPQKLSIVALDADGNAIVGAGAPALSVSTANKTLTSTGPTASAPNTVVLQATTTSSSSSSSSSGPPTVTPGSVNLSLKVTPPADSGAPAKSLTVPVAIAHSAIYVAFNTGGIIDEIGVYYDGNTTAKPNLLIFGKLSRLEDVDQLTVDANGTLYVTTEFPTSSSSSSNSTAGQVLEFPAGANGSVAPNVTIFGLKTQLSTPFGVAVGHNGSLYVANSGSNSIVEFPQGASGNVAPSTTISGSNTGLDVPECDTVDSAGTLYVVNFSGGVTEYPSGSNGNVTPTTIAGSNPNFKGPQCVAVDGNENLYVSDETPSVAVFPPGASGNAVPEARIQGPLTFLPGIVYALAVDAAGTIYAGGSSNDVTEYAPGASGNAAPIAAIPTNFSVFALYAVPAPAVNVITP